MIAKPFCGQNTSMIQQTADKDEIVRVQLDTVDHFYGAQNINHIQILKIDTEGHEINVLKGARHFLQDGKIDFIMAECDFWRRSDNDPHADFFEALNYLKPYGHYVVSFYTNGVDEAGAFDEPVGKTG